MELSTVAAILVILQLFHFHYQSKVHSLATPSDHDFSYMKFVNEATDAPLENEYDYIIVGGGTAGCPLAATLSANYSVLVLERGSTPSTYPSVLREEEYVIALQQEDDGKTPGERFVSEDGVANVRARILGGSSMINFGFYSRAEEDFYEKSGIDWDMNLVHDAYEWVESSLVFRPNNLTVWQSAVRDALVEAGVGPDNGFDLNHVQGTKLSGSTFDNSGRRHGAVELLNRGNPQNLQVVVHATVERIVFLSDESGLAAHGVVYSDSNMKSHKAIIRGNGEIVLSAGAIGSPQLLLLSGVGPESYLSSLNIPVIHPQPYTGQFMFDNPRNFINIIPPFQMEPSTVKIVGITRSFYVQAISSLPITNTPPFGFFPHPSSSLRTNSTFGHICVKCPGPLSHGSLTLRSSSDVRIGPNVKFNYFENPADLTKCVIGMKKVVELLKTESLKPFKAHQDLPGVEGFNFLGQPLPMNETDDVSFEKFCRDTTTTYWHYHGGCLVGKVADGNWRVMGINSLRVVDGSTFNSSPATNPQATVMMLGRYVGAKMLKERAAYKKG